MISRPDDIIVDEVTQKIGTKVIGKKLFHFKTIDSTSLHARKLVNEGIDEGVVVISDVQLHGRGRKDRNWSSPEGGLWFSVVLYPKISPEQGMLVTMSASVAVAQAIKDTTNLRPIIKWPNDILLNGKKVCGILTELDAKMGRINHSIVGIGINVNNEIEKDLQNIAVSLKQETGSQISRVELLQSILKYFDENYAKMLSGKYNIIRDSWFSFSDILGRKVKVKGEKEVTLGTVSDIDESGCLILETDKGKVKIISGDVEYL